MTRLHSIVVVPAAVVVLATTTPGSSARACKPVILPSSWAAACEPAAEHAGDEHPRATAVEPVASLPVAGPVPASAAAVPGGVHVAPAASAGDDATGGTVAASARGPPARPA